jgi:ABC-type glycerol-3-phosphate transport system permease component
VFQVTLENYQKLMPPQIPQTTYVFIAEALIGIFAFFLPLRNTTVTRLFGLLWGGVLISTCLCTFAMTTNYNFLMLAIYSTVAYLLTSPWKAADVKRLRLSFVSAGVLAIIAVCTSLADGGSRYFSQLLNSIIIGFGSTILAVGLGTLSAYAFSRFKVARKEDLLFFILSTRMLPPVVVVIPIYLMYSVLGLRDTHLGLILLYTTFNVSFAVWLMKGFIDEIPKEYEDAALVDGYTRFQTFIKVVLPQSVTGIAATAVFCLITAWNEFAFALVLTEVGGKAVTAPPSITSAVGSGGVDWGRIAAATFVFLLPVAIFTFLMRRHLLRGVTFGAVKK